MMMILIARPNGVVVVNVVVLLAAAAVANLLLLRNAAGYGLDLTTRAHRSPRAQKRRDSFAGSYRRRRHRHRLALHHHNVAQGDNDRIPPVNEKYEEERSTSRPVHQPNDDNDTTTTTKTIGVYVHIPFCRRRCRYCDFAIVPIGTKVDTEQQQEGIYSNPEDDSRLINPDTTTVTSKNTNPQQQQSFLEMEERYTNTILQEWNQTIHQQYEQQQQQQQQQQTSETPKPSSPKNNNPPSYLLRSIYFGGGTPSLASIGTLERILTAIITSSESGSSFENGNHRPLFRFDASQCEITIEMDPGTFTKTKLQAIKELGFNRISLGVQSFQDDILESLGRVHRKHDIDEAIASIGDVFGDDDANYSLDLISGLPGLTLAQWTETLSTAVHLQPPPNHISIYDLQIESGTVFGSWYNEDTSASSSSSTYHATQGEAPVPLQRRPMLPSEDDCAFMYKYAAGYLRSKGYEHYEVSSYARTPEYRSIHNQIYWDTSERTGQWFALGLGATSFQNGELETRPRALVDYYRYVADRSTSSHLNAPAIKDEDDKIVDTLMDIVLKRLRTSDGLSLDFVEKKFGPLYVQAILRGAQLGLDLGLAQQENKGKLGSILRLTDPDGFLYSNSIISSIFVELEGA